MDRLIEILKQLSNRYASKWLVLAFDIAIVIFTFFLAYVIRYNFELEFDFKSFLIEIPFIILFSAISFIVVSTHKGVVRFTGFQDVVNLIVGMNILATILIVTTYLSREFGFGEIYDIPGSIIYIHLLLNMLFLIGAKFFIKSMYHSIISDMNITDRVLIYGAGNSGMVTYDVVANDPKSNLDVVAFVDRNESKVGKKINQLNVYHPSQINQDFITKYQIDEVIISIQNIDPDDLIEITNKLFMLNLKVKIVPPVQHWIDGDLSAGQIKDVKIEDLLGREPIQINNPVLEEEYNNKTMLITGAAGSIGSEIVRKLALYNYSKMILVDNSESAIYNLQQELIQSNTSRFIAIVADVRDEVRMDYIFNQYKPDIVFHAAAYKHVPLMEDNPFEAVKVNVIGTCLTANLAMKYSVKKFTLISTDKAVNPTNVMGASKRIAEMYLNCQKKQSNTKFLITRFGNVLGSNGSVIPLFKKQIEAGGPLTVTHEDIIRYFMTIPEACQLVLEAAAMGFGNEIFVFDMGKPIRIFDLAVNMISLSGFRYPEDINIKIIGLRPGEKICEELLIDGENTKPTYHEKIMIAKCKGIDKSTILPKIEKLCNATPNTSNAEIVAMIKDIVPEYTPNNTKYNFLNIEVKS
ncbi:polysaccharide biosynthesis protein [Mangrovimonas aestuarii]|uniref:polysaccharide biosynthesis protein n=1 Tax=Mangrovimonas aestuarii TaxID=3018443 RepID=UPI0023780A5D|nr:nucleoside-diphosphate sugar epimerase/dehydratase [Mangrovimonas aestuarii]